MPQTLNIGVGAQAGERVVSVYVPPDGTGVNVAVIAGDTLNYLTAINGTAGTIAKDANHDFTISPLWVYSSSISSVTFTGAGY